MTSIIPRLRITSAKNYFSTKIFMYGVGALGSLWLLLSIVMYQTKKSLELSILLLSLGMFCFSLMICGLQAIKYAIYSREAAQHMDEFREVHPTRGFINTNLNEDKPPAYREAIMREETPPPSYNVALILSSLGQTEL